MRCAGAEAVGTGAPPGCSRARRRRAGARRRAGLPHGVARRRRQAVLGVVFHGSARVERGDIGRRRPRLRALRGHAALGLAGLARVALGDRKAFRRAERRLLDARRGGADGAATAAEAAVPARRTGAAAVALAGVDVAYAGAATSRRGVSLRAAAGGSRASSARAARAGPRCCGAARARRARRGRGPRLRRRRQRGAAARGGRRTLASRVQQGAAAGARAWLLDAVAYLASGRPSTSSGPAAVAACADSERERRRPRGDVGRDAGDLSGSLKNRRGARASLYQAARACCCRRAGGLHGPGGRRRRAGRGAAAGLCRAARGALARGDLRHTSASRAAARGAATALPRGRPSSR